MLLPREIEEERTRRVEATYRDLGEVGDDRTEVAGSLGAGARLVVRTGSSQKRDWSREQGRDEEIQSWGCPWKEPGPACGREPTGTSEEAEMELKPWLDLGEDGSCRCRTVRLQKWLGGRFESTGTEPEEGQEQPGAEICGVGMMLEKGQQQPREGLVSAGIVSESLGDDMVDKPPYHAQHRLEDPMHIACCMENPMHVDPLLPSIVRNHSWSWKLGPRGHWPGAGPRGHRPGACWEPPYGLGKEPKAGSVVESGQPAGSNKEKVRRSWEKSCHRRLPKEDDVALSHE